MRSYLVPGVFNLLDQSWDALGEPTQDKKSSLGLMAFEYS